VIYREEFAAQKAEGACDLHLSIDWRRDPDGLLDEDASEGWPRVDLAAPSKTQIAPDQTRFTGYVPQVLQAVAPTPERTIAVTCGPPAMIFPVFDVLEGLGFAPEQIFTTLERRMKCGIGLCGRCNMGPAFLCTEGPVFSYAQLKDLPEALS